MKRSFFERISGSSVDVSDQFDDELPASNPQNRGAIHTNSRSSQFSSTPNATEEGQLPIDVHQTATTIVIRAFVAGVRPDDLNISISRDMVEISGMRSEREQVSEQDYFIRELFWGSFSRTIMLPQEVDVDASTAASKDGLLSIILPKLDKARQTKLRVKTG